MQLRAKQLRRVTFILFSGYYSVHPRKGRVVLSKIPLVWWASGHLTIRTDTSFTPAPLNRDRSFYLSGVIPRYKGVLWCLKCKHPWVAEIKIIEKKTKKMWIGTFDTYRRYIPNLGHDTKFTVNGFLVDHSLLSIILFFQLFFLIVKCPCFLVCTNASRDNIQFNNYHQYKSQKRLCLELMM
jgi:hypothetical protein